jgi:cell division protein FtsI/penicillin-binding protein 2
MLAAAVVNDGIMMKPYLVRSVVAEEGMLLYQPEPQPLSRPISSATARAMRKLMRQTVKTGTARKSFRRFLRKRKDVEVGGKTGTLTGLDPKGKTDWFVGYARLGGQKIAFASVTVNKEKWTVKSHYVARRVIESWLSAIKER